MLFGEICNIMIYNTTINNINIYTMKYLKRFNEGLFSTYNNDQEIADMLYQYLFDEDYNVITNDNSIIANNLKLDEYVGIYNVRSTQNMLTLEYYKFGNLIFKKELNCNISTIVNIYNLLKEKSKNGNY